MILAIMGGLTLLAASTVSAQVPAEAREKKICQTERLTGSLTRTRRICMTRDEWDQLRRDTKQDIDNIQRNSGAVPRQQSGPGAPAGSG